MDCIAKLSLKFGEKIFILFYCTSWRSHFCLSGAIAPFFGRGFIALSTKIVLLPGEKCNPKVLTIKKSSFFCNPGLQSF